MPRQEISRRRQRSYRRVDGNLDAGSSARRASKEMPDYHPRFTAGVTYEVRDAQLDKTAHVPHAVPARLLKRIADSVEPSLQPVRPLAPNWVLTLGAVLIGGAVAFVGAARAGFQGVEVQSITARVLIFGALGLLAGVAALQVVPANSACALLSFVRVTLHEST
jgi:hypothetical protein